jgi:alkylhydroperoxidase family enzyme
MGNPRIVPVTQDDVAEDLRPLLKQIAITGTFVPNVSTTMAVCPGLFRPFLGFGEHFVTKSTLPDRDRELAVQRIASLCGCEYIKVHHGVMGKTAGLSDEELARAAEGPDAPGWSDSDQALLRVVDELHATNNLGDEGYKVLSSRWNSEQIVEFVMAIGFYAMSSTALNTFQTQLEPEITGEAADLRERAKA